VKLTKPERGHLIEALYEAIDSKYDVIDAYGRRIRWKQMNSLKIQSDLAMERARYRAMVIGLVVWIVAAAIEVILQ